MPIQMLCDKDKVQRIKSTLIEGLEIKQHGTKYGVTGKLKRDYGTLFFGGLRYPARSKRIYGCPVPANRGREPPLMYLMWLPDSS